jgi:plastocyanin
MPRKLLPLAFVLALVAAACAEPPAADIEFGSGLRFVPMVADSLNNSGVEPSVAVTSEGLPIVAYFAFEEVPEGDALPQTRPVGAPSIPGVMLATLSSDGIWTRGAIALQASIPNVQIPFNPAFDETVADLTAANVTGLDLVVDEDAFHVAWGSGGGLYYATGSTDPAATEQVQLSQVIDEPVFGPSIAVVGGSPRISYYTSTSSAASVELARPEGDGWAIEQISTAPSCDTCTTAVIATPDGLAVAFSAGNSVHVAMSNGENGWSSRNVEQGGGQGLSGVATGDGMALSYYLGTEVHVATGSSTGSFDTATAGNVAQGSGEEEGAETSIAADDAGALWLAWFDADEGVVFASSGDEGFTPVETQPDTASGAVPSVDVTPDGSTAFVAWYDTEHEDALVGEYGEIEGLAIAAPSPEPAGVPPVVQPGADCTQAVSGVVQLTALGIAFDASCVEVPAAEPFTIAFGNEDDGVPHNVAIYPNADDLANPLLQGEVITGLDSIEYQADALDEGEYYFQCDVHPTMNGSWNAVAGGGDGDGGGGGGATGATGGTGSTNGGGGGGGGGAAVTVTAQNIAFDTDTIELPADTASTITFDNQDSGVPHNIAIYADDTLSETLFQGELITGPDTIDYAIDPLEAGEYYFQCDVHPDMNGTVVVA